MIQIFSSDVKKKFGYVNNIHVIEHNNTDNNSINIERKLSFRCMNDDKFECSLCVHYNKTCEKCEYDTKAKKSQINQKVEKK